MKVLKPSQVKKIGQRRYPWKKWFSKKGFSITKGVDFDCTPYSMSIQLRNAASRAKKSISIHIEENTLSVRIF